MNDSTRPVTGFHARTDAEKLAKIAALCDESERDAAAAGDSLPYLPVQYVRAVLAEPGPAVPVHDIDRDALRPVEGVVLTPEEADRISGALRWIDEYAPINVRINSHAKEIAARLEDAAVRASAPVSDTRTGGVA